MNKKILFSIILTPFVLLLFFLSFFLMNINNAGSTGTIVYESLRGKTNPVVDKINLIEDHTDIIAKSCLSSVVSVKTTNTQNTNKEYNGDSPGEFLGSGIILSEDGYIITNYHIIKSADTIKISIIDVYGREIRTLDAEMVSYDEYFDIALLKVNSDIPLTPAYIGNSNGSDTGDSVLAIGNPFALSGTVTAGIVSCVDRELRNSKTIHKPIYYIQTDATINTGNSGGALIDRQGRLIGMNTLIYSEGSGNNIGINFALPVEYIKGCVPFLLQEKKVPYPFIGVITGEDIISDAGYKFNSDEGLYIVDVYENSPVHKSGIKRDDIILSINNIKINTKAELHKNLFAFYGMGEVLNFVINKGGENINTEIAVEEYSDNKNYIYNELFMGILIDIDNSKNIKGAFVSGVIKGSPAYKKGIEYGDVITDIDYTSINGIDEYREVISKIDKKKPRYLITLKRFSKNKYINKSIYIENEKP